MRQWLQPDANRLAICYWWPVYELRDAKVEIRLALLRKTSWAYLPQEWRVFSTQVLQEAIDDLWDVHQVTASAIADAATDALRAGRGRPEVVAAALAIARRSAPLPPPWLVTQSIDGAAREHRFSQKSWKRAARRPTPGVHNAS